MRQITRTAATIGWLRASMIVGLWVGACATAPAATADLGGGFTDHGVATPMSNHRGTVATSDGDGRNVVLVWLYDHRGGYALLCIDAATGESEQFDTPFKWRGDGPFASLLSSRNRYYALFGDHFVEFDPAKREFTFTKATAAGTAMALTEDDAGLIWAATYPECGLVAFDPATRTLRDYGHVYEQNWPRYPRGLAVDEAGWVYMGVGNTASQILSVNPETGDVTPLLSDHDRQRGMAVVFRASDGSVYGAARGDASQWFELRGGAVVRELDGQPAIERRPIVAGDQNLTHREFPDGKRLVACDLVKRQLTITDPQTGANSTVSFDYHSDGAHLMGVATAPDGTLCGGTAFPMRFFSYAPQSDTWVNEPAFGQWNTVVAEGDAFFVGGYPGGFLLEWTPQHTWQHTRKDNPESNPRYLVGCAPSIHRPHDLLACDNGRQVILAGTPDYGYTGGGLLFWDRTTSKHTLREHTELLPDQSTMSLVETAAGKIVGGTTTNAGTGGERLAQQAELYILDLATQTIEWHEPLFPNSQSYLDLCNAPDGQVYGIVDRKLFFVFDPHTRTVVHQQQLEGELGPTASHQGPRILIRGEGDAVYLLLAQGIAQIDPQSFELQLLATSPRPITAGGDLLDGRLYFASGSHLLSFEFPQRHVENE